jgi:hypothetical protein
LWGGEGCVKGYKIGQPKIKKKILPRFWLPDWWFPALVERVLYSEVLNRCVVLFFINNNQYFFSYMRIIVTEGMMRQCEDMHGFDNYILGTNEVDLHSKLGCKLKRLMLVALAKGEHAPGKDEEFREEVGVSLYPRILLCCICL